MGEEQAKKLSEIIGCQQGGVKSGYIQYKQGQYLDDIS